mmetsp:Transcript_28002/g.77038  ORF Transcript_28002/g.77038 Transcript_28002/m.77038 type:complete len:382 (+) Transcript_28002:356-1501(+)
MDPSPDQERGTVGGLLLVASSSSSGEGGLGDVGIFKRRDVADESDGFGENSPNVFFFQLSEVGPQDRFGSAATSLDLLRATLRREPMSPSTFSEPTFVFMDCLVSLLSVCFGLFSAVFVSSDDTLSFAAVGERLCSISLISAVFSAFVSVGTAISIVVGSSARSKVEPEGADNKCDLSIVGLPVAASPEGLVVPSRSGPCTRGVGGMSFRLSFFFFFSPLLETSGDFECGRLRLPDCFLDNVRFTLRLLGGERVSFAGISFLLLRLRNVSSTTLACSSPVSAEPATVSAQTPSSSIVSDSSSVDLLLGSSFAPFLLLPLRSVLEVFLPLEAFRLVFPRGDAVLLPSSFSSRLLLLPFFRFNFLLDAFCCDSNDVDDAFIES